MRSFSFEAVIGRTSSHVCQAREPRNLQSQLRAQPTMMRFWTCFSHPAQLTRATLAKIKYPKTLRER